VREKRDGEMERSELCVCVCVCVCERERERERGRKGEIQFEKYFIPLYSVGANGDGKDVCALIC